LLEGLEGQTTDPYVDKACANSQVVSSAIVDKYISFRFTTSFNKTLR